MQADGRTDFEDGLRIATTLEVSNDLHSVRTSPEVNMAGPNKGRLDPGVVWTGYLFREADQCPTLLCSG